jgi:hypothetical protein
MTHHDRLWKVCKKLPEDWSPYGQKDRWHGDHKSDADCSSGCAFYYTLEPRDGEDVGCDWGVCTNPESHRCGLLTFEHQGCEHFKIDKMLLEKELVE